MLAICRRMSCSTYPSNNSGKNAQALAVASGSVDRRSHNTGGSLRQGANFLAPPPWAKVRPQAHFRPVHPPTSAKTIDSKNESRTVLIVLLMMFLVVDDDHKGQQFVQTDETKDVDAPPSIAKVLSEINSRPLLGSYQALSLSR